MRSSPKSSMFVEFLGTPISQHDDLDDKPSMDDFWEAPISPLNALHLAPSAKVRSARPSSCLRMWTDRRFRRGKKNIGGMCENEHVIRMSYEFMGI